MPIIDLPHGRIHYRLAGPDNSAAPAVVLVHGLLVNSELWMGAADALARSELPAANLFACAADITKHSSTARNAPPRSLCPFSTAHCHRLPQGRPTSSSPPVSRA